MKRNVHCAVHRHILTQVLQGRQQLRRWKWIGTAHVLPVVEVQSLFVRRAVVLALLFGLVERLPHIWRHLVSQQTSALRGKLLARECAGEHQPTETLGLAGGESRAEHASPALAEEVEAGVALQPEVIHQVVQLVLKQLLLPERLVPGRLLEMRGRGTSYLVIKDDREAIVPPEICESEEILVSGARPAMSHNNWGKATGEVTKDLIVGETGFVN